MFPGFDRVDNLYLQVRYAGEIHEVREFITPQQWHVQRKVEDISSRMVSDLQKEIWQFVCADVRYPLDVWGRVNEYHKLQAYAYRGYFVSGLGWRPVTLINQQVYNEWFDFPWEILSQEPMVADCDGSSILLCSLLIAAGFPSYVAIGGIFDEPQSLTHAWVITHYNGEWQSWETTTNEAGLALPVENEYYYPLCYFNDQEIFVDPQLYGELSRLDYIPQVGDVFSPIGFIRNDIKKSKVLDSICLERSVSNVIAGNL